MSRFSFSPQELGHILIKIENELFQTSFKSPQPILESLRVSTLAESIIFLNDELEKYKTNNFFPISSKIIFILACTYKFNGDTEKWVLRMLECLSPKYRNYFKHYNEMESQFIKEIGEIDVTVDLFLEHVHFLPFEIYASFERTQVLPSQQLKAIISAKSLFKTTINSVNLSMTVMNDKKQICCFPIYKDYDLHPEKKNIKEIVLDSDNYFIQNMKYPGSVLIKYVSISFGNNQNIKLAFKPFTISDNKRSVNILPYEDDISFSIQRLPFAFIKQPFTFTAKFMGLPPNCSGVSCESTIIANKNSPIFTNQTTKMINILDNPQEKDVSFDFTAFSTEKTDAIFTLQWEVYYQTKEEENKIISRNDKFNITFIPGFATTFKIFGPNGVPCNDNTIQRGTQYTIVSIFEDNIKQHITIDKVETVPSDKSISILNNDLPLPLPLSLSESFTFASFISLNSPKNTSSNLGSIRIYFTIDDSNNSKSIFEIPLPEIKFFHTDADCYINEITPKQNEKSELQLEVKCNNESLFSTQCKIEVGQSDFYSITQREFDIVLDTKTNIVKIPFISLEKGIRAFPQISLTNQEGNILWTSTPFINTI